MADISRESLDCNIVSDREAAEHHGKGGLWYSFVEGSAKRFPEDVTSVCIMMPLTHAEAWPGDAGNMIEPYKSECVPIYWHTRHPSNATARHQWDLSGTINKPTLSPSLNWIGCWHGFLKQGRLESC